MALVENSHEFATGVFGNDGTVENLAKRAAAGIYYAIILQNEVDIKSDILIGVERNLRKLLIDDEIEMIIDHYEMVKGK